jgi:hypothetical protein
MPSCTRPRISNTCCTACTAPGIARIQVKRVAAKVLGAPIDRGFLEAECIHAEEVAVVRHVARPGGHRRRKAVAQHQRAAEIEVDEMRRLQRDEVARPPRRAIASTLDWISGSAASS